MKAANPDLNIEILGLNNRDDAIFNSLATSGRTLPWLQDTVQDAVWDHWGVTWRDVRILDSQNRLHAVYNLTVHDLALEANRSDLKVLFLSAAKVTDADLDRLPDDWELKYFRNLAAKPTEDFDHDGSDNFSELAFGTDPTKAESRVAVNTQMSGAASQRVMRVSFRRRTGPMLDYALEASSDLVRWSANSSKVTEADSPRNLFDGSGTVEVLYEMPATVAPQAFLRVRAVPRP